ncbi:MAG TPA: phosphate ABC transporter substrate-binding protein, partial [Treponema sp.]|nr:phosphate ABC transporter substrate-binding protein [Treponema sp.]
DTADITNSTEVVLTSVAGNSSAIGYISLGSLNSAVKALKIDGAGASVANIRNGSYKISRPFNIVTKPDLSDAAKEFYRYILSSDGQAVIEKNGYIAAVKNPAYMVNVKTGKVTVAGSSSVFPVMEKLAEAFKAANPGVTVEVSQSDSTTGINSATQGVCDIGMASRELTDGEIAKGVTGTKIALDGIAIIVNKVNPAEGLSKEQVRRIFTGEITKWTELK